MAGFPPTAATTQSRYNTGPAAHGCHRPLLQQVGFNQSINEFLCPRSSGDLLAADLRPFADGSAVRT